jgi:putative DNA methylase
MPLVASLALATKPGKTAWLDPEVDHLRKRVTFRVSAAEPSEGKSIKIGRGVSFRCLVCGQVAEDEYIRLFGRSRGFGQRLLAIVAEGKGRRQYLPASSSQANLTEAVRDLPSTEALLSTHPQYMAPPRFGLVRHSDIFSPRQLLALNTFGELLDDVRSAVRTDASGVMADDGVGLSAGGTGATAYSEAVAVFLAFAIDKAANYWSSVCTWHKTAEKLVSTFGLPVLSMAWDWCEANPFSDSSGNWMLGVEQAAKVAETLPTGRPGTAIHADATKLAGDSVFLVSTDPPYYDSQVLECL